MLPMTQREDGVEREARRWSVVDVPLKIPQLSLTHILIPQLPTVLLTGCFLNKFTVCW